MSPTLGLVGVAVAATGAVMLAPKGTEHHILGETYCVSHDARDVNYGDCSKSISMMKIGAGLLGAGVVMAYLGFRSKTVTVAPTVSPQVVGGTATIRWGK